MVQIKQILCNLEDPKIAQILNREEVYFLVTRITGIKSFLKHIHRL